MSAIPAPDEQAAGYARALPRTAESGRLGLALVVIASAQLMVVLDATIVNVALPHVQRALGFSGSGLEWVVNAYAVTFGGLLLLGGRAGDRLGRRRVFVGGLLVFSAASLLCGFATGQWWLLAARAVQGAGGAVIAPNALALITTTFPEGEQRRKVRDLEAGPHRLDGSPLCDGRLGPELDQDSEERADHPRARAERDQSLPRHSRIPLSIKTT